MYPKFTRTISIDPTGEGPRVSPCFSPLGNSSLLNTMIQLKQGSTPKHNKTISELMFKNDLADQSKILQPNNRNFEANDCTSKSKPKPNRATISFVKQNQNASKLNNRREDASAPSYTENSEEEINLDFYA